MKKSSIILISITIIGVIIIILFKFYFAKRNLDMNIDLNLTTIEESINYVPDEKTAIKIADSIWYSIYGEKIYSKKPFKGTLKNGIWIVEGTLQEGYKGGVPYIEIQQIDSKVLTVSHGK